jgi:formate hydrogenlyase subunit 3/multisubunit Na+/H+ antiporter MnhD subunit
MLIGLGLLNILWGGLASWLTEKSMSAWHYSFMADWGLALCAFGVLVADGQAAAVLLLYGIVLSRLPLYLWSRQSLRESIQTDRPINLLAAAMLAGAAPFAGFAARLFLLRGATQLYWPLALVIGIGLLLWLPPSLRLGRSLGTPRGREALGVGIALALSVAIGIYPQPILSLAGL